MISARKQKLRELSESAERHDYETLYIQKYDLTLEVQAYFLGKLDVGDMKAVQELVRVFCSKYGKVPEGHMSISAILPCDPFDYLQPARKKKKAKIVKIFAQDEAFHKAELKNVRKNSCPIQDAQLKDYAAKLNAARDEDQEAAEDRSGD